MTITILTVLCLFTHAVFALPAVSSGTLHTHLSADSGAYTDPGGPVAGPDEGVGFWIDQSGKGHHAIQLDPARRPLWDPNECNGRPALKFDRDDDFLQILFDPNDTGNPVHTLVQPHTIFLVLNTYEETNRYVFDGINSTDREVMAVGLSANPGVWFFWAGQNFLTIDVTQGVPQNHTLVIDSGNLEHFIYGITRGSGTIGTRNLKNGMKLGAHNGGTMNSDMDVVELIIYQGALSPIDREAVEDYLMVKYGLYPCPDYGPGTLKAQYDGTEVAANGYSRVTSWNDQVNEMDLMSAYTTPEDDPNLPTLEAEAFATGAKNVIHFDGVSNGLLSDRLASSVKGATTMFVVARRTTDAASTYIFDGLDENNRRAFMADGTPRTLAIYSEDYHRSYPPDVGLWQVFSLIYNGICSQIFVDGFTSEPEFNYTGLLPFEGLTVGARYGGESNRFVGDIAEIIVYEGALETSIRQGIEQSLFAKYGIGPTCGAAYTTYNEMDFDRDCLVSLSDLAVFVQEWLTCTTPGDPQCD